MKVIRGHPFGDQLKYTGNEQFLLRLPGHPQMLGVHVYDNVPWLYYIETPIFPDMLHYFMVFKDLEVLPDAIGSYIGSFQINQGTKRNPDLHMFHLFITHREVGQKDEEG